MGRTRAPRHTAQPVLTQSGHREHPVHLPLDVAHAAWLKVGLAGVLGFVLLMVCGFGSWRILRDEQTGTRANANTADALASAPGHDIGDRGVDPVPLSVDEVFPGRQVKVDGPPYRVLAAASSGNCAAAAEGAVRKLLAGLGCNQVVRATLRSPTGSYIITAGIFNLRDDAAARGAYDRLKRLVDARKGRFDGLLVGRSTRPLELASTHLGWDYRGHFLVYCVIARANGGDIDAGDREAQRILYDVIESHLIGTVVQNRTLHAPNRAAGIAAAPAGAQE